MIRYQNFEFERDNHGWKLHVWRAGVSRKKEPIMVSETFYYAKVENVLNSILDRSFGECKDIVDMISLLKTFPTSWDISGE